MKQQWTPFFRSHAKIAPLPPRIGPFPDSSRVFVYSYFQSGRFPKKSSVAVNRLCLFRCTHFSRRFIISSKWVKNYSMPTIPSMEKSNDLKQRLLVNIESVSCTGNPRIFFEKGWKTRRTIGSNQSVARVVRDIPHFPILHNSADGFRFILCYYYF